MVVLVIYERYKVNQFGGRDVLKNAVYLSIIVLFMCMFIKPRLARLQEAQEGRLTRKKSVHIYLFPYNSKGMPFINKP